MLIDGSGTPFFSQIWLYAGCHAQLSDQIEEAICIELLLLTFISLIN